jgi:hypothetical protein
MKLKFQWLVAIEIPKSIFFLALFRLSQRVNTSPTNSVSPCLVLVPDLHLEVDMIYFHEKFCNVLSLVSYNKATIYLYIMTYVSTNNTTPCCHFLKILSETQVKMHRKMAEQMKYPHGLPPSNFQGHNPV